MAGIQTAPYNAHSVTILTASLYLLCLAFLFGSALYVYSRDPFSRLNFAYALLALSLLGWVGTLFVFSAQDGGPALLWLGRANFAAAALLAPAVFGFVRALRQERIRHAGWIWAETALVMALSLLTGLVDRSEAVRSGIHVTEYGPLFIPYVAHILAFVLAALWLAFRPDDALHTRVRQQLRLVGAGILATAAVGVVADAVLPYLFGDFRFLNVGTLSTILFLAAVAYAACVHHLFDVRVVIRRALVFALLIAFALELYRGAVESLTQLLPLGDPVERQVAAAAIALIVNAFTHEPLRWWLERLADRLLAGKRGHPPGDIAKRHRS